MIKLDCPNCLHLAKFADEFAGKRATCEKCGEPLVIPHIEKTKMEDSVLFSGKLRKSSEVGSGWSVSPTMTVIAVLCLLMSIVVVIYTVHRLDDFISIALIIALSFILWGMACVVLLLINIRDEIASLREEQRSK